MEYIRKLETMVAGWYKNMPHLPAAGQKWLAQNVWWLVLIWVILGAFAIFSMLMAALFAGAFLAGFGPLGAIVGGLALIAVTVAMVFGVINIVLGAIAINPLKATQKKGWTLLFIIALLNVVAEVLAFLFDFNIFALVWGLLLVTVGAYFLFEIREHFDGVKAGRKKVAAKQKKTEK